MAWKDGQFEFDVVELMMANNQFKAFSINLNARHVNGMTPFILAAQSVKLVNTWANICTIIKYSRVLCSDKLFLLDGKELLKSGRSQLGLNWIPDVWQHSSKLIAFHFGQSGQSNNAVLLLLLGSSSHNSWLILVVPKQQHQQKL